MKHEVLLKAYVQYQSDDAFRDLVAGTLDEIYSTSLRIVPGAPYLAEEVALRAYSELVRQAPKLNKNVVISAWLRERMCKIAVRLLRAEDRFIDWAALNREKVALSAPPDISPAPAGLAIRICRTIFLSVAWRKCHAPLLPWLKWPAWIRPAYAVGATICLAVMIGRWCLSSPAVKPIIPTQATPMTPASYAQLASPAAGPPATPDQIANASAGTSLDPK